MKKSEKTEIKPESKSKNIYTKIPNISLNKKSNINNKKDSNTLFDNENEKKTVSIESSSITLNYNYLVFSPSDIESKTINKDKPNINLTINKGEFICIIGKFANGKSALIKGILNNMIIDDKTKLIVNGNISYVSQESWIQNNAI